MDPFASPTTTPAPAASSPPPTWSQPPAPAGPDGWAAAPAGPDGWAAAPYGGGWAPPRQRSTGQVIGLTVLVTLGVQAVLGVVLALGFYGLVSAEDSASLDHLAEVAPDLPQPTGFVEVDTVRLESFDLVPELHVVGTAPAAPAAAAEEIARTLRAQGLDAVGLEHRTLRGAFDVYVVHAVLPDEGLEVAYLVSGTEALDPYTNDPVETADPVQAPAGGSAVTLAVVEVWDE